MKNKKSLQSMAGFMGVLSFLIMRHASISMEMIMSGIITIIALFMFVCTICISKYRKATGAAFLGVIMAVMCIIITYLDLKNVNNGSYFVIAMFFMILIPIMTYRIAVKFGNKELLKKARESLIGVSVFIGLLILLIAGLYIYSLLTRR